MDGCERDTIEFEYENKSDFKADLIFYKHNNGGSGGYVVNDTTAVMIMSKRQ